MAKINTTNNEELQRVIAGGMQSGDIVAYHAAHTIRFDKAENAPQGVKLLTVDEVARFSGWSWWRGGSR